MPQAAIAYLCEINKGTPTKDGIPVLTQVCDEITVLLMLLFSTTRPNEANLRACFGIARRLTFTSLVQDMCFNAFARLANPKEPVETYEQKIIARVRETVARLRYANTIMPDVKVRATLRQI